MCILPTFSSVAFGLVPVILLLDVSGPLLSGCRAAGRAGYRAFQDEKRPLNRERQEAAAADAAAGKALELLLEIRASLHAYVAPGQGLPFGPSAPRKISTRCVRRSSRSMA